MVTTAIPEEPPETTVQRMGHAAQSFAAQTSEAMTGRSALSVLDVVLAILVLVGLMFAPVPAAITGGIALVLLLVRQAGRK